jgi:hypothetical protein
MREPPREPLPGPPAADSRGARARKSPGHRREPREPREPLVPNPTGPTPAELVIPAAPDEEEDEPDWKEYPEGASGPVVVGRVARYGDPDPECWVALENTADPAAQDPSEVETLSHGRFRLVGFAPGRYRVRVQGDDTVASYSAPFEARDGAVADAGTIRILKPGCVAGLLRAPDGGEVPGKVALFGRDPASLAATVVARGPSLRLQGFQVLPPEAGAYLLAATAKEGWALHRGTTDAQGIAWAEIRLEPWSTLAVEWGPARQGAPATKGLTAALRPVEVPDLGQEVDGRERDAPALFERLPPGRYAIRARWFVEEEKGTWKEEVLEREVSVARGVAAREVLER